MDATYDGSVFSIRERDELRDRLIVAARADDRIIAAAVVGSGARDAEDAWSDIDLALRLGDGLDLNGVADDWTARMYESAGAVDTFAASGSFRLLFGESNERLTSRSAVPGDLIGMGWLHALHARSSIARGRTLQALHMINGVRDQVITLACLRHQLPAHHGRGVDDLPVDLRQRIAETLVRRLDETELWRAFAMSVSILLDEAQRVDPDREQRLRAVARELAHIAG